MAFMWTRSWSCLRTVSHSHRNALQRTSVVQRQGISTWTKTGGSLWSFLKRARRMTISSMGVKSAHRPLIAYGMAAFLWEREKIPTEDVQRCLKYYEDRVRASCDDSPTPIQPISHQPPTPVPAAVTPTTRSSWFSWFTRQPELKAEGLEEEEPVNEKELKQQQFIAEWTASYEEHSQQQMSQLPLVGLRPKVPIGYKLGHSVAKKAKASVATLVKQVSKLTQNNIVPLDFKPIVLSCCKKVSDLACIDVEPHHHNLLGDWKPVAMDTVPSNPFRDAGYPLVGLHDRGSKVMDRIITFVDRPMRNSLENFVHTFDHVLGTDSILDHSIAHYANTLRQLLLQYTLKAANNFIEEEQLSESSDNSSTQKSSIDCLSEEKPLSTPASMPSTLPEEKFSLSSHEQRGSSIDYLSEWELFLNEASYMVFRKPYADTGLYQFKVIGSYDDVTAKDFYEVQVNEEARMSWDHYVTRLKTVDFDPRSGCEVVHWVMKFPFPMSKREYVYVHKSWVSPKEDAIVFVNKSVTHPFTPESSSSVRVKDYYSEMVIKAHSFIDEPGLNYELTYFDDPQVHLPTSCVNWVAHSATPDFLNKVHNAALLARQNTQGPQMLAA